MSAYLRELGWELVLEYSFSRYGERGSVDIVGWHPPTRSLLIVEVKSRLWDIQETLMKLDRKRLLVPPLLAADRLWRAERIGAVLALPDSRADRRAFADHATIFAAALPSRGRAVGRWLRRPDGDLSGAFMVRIARYLVIRRRATRRAREHPRVRLRGGG